MKKIFLTGDGYAEAHFGLLEKMGFHIEHRSDDVSAEEVLSIIPSVDAYVLGGVERLTEVELAAAKKLRAISFVGKGYGAFIDEVAALRNSIKIYNTPAVMAPAVMEVTLGLVIGLRRKLFEQNAAIKASASIPLLTPEVGSAHIGIIGMGAIGSSIARVLRSAFGAEVSYFSRSRKHDLEKEIGMQWAPLDELLPQVDILILMVPTSEDTKHLLNSANIPLLKPGAILINTAGAALVEPVALYSALANGHLGAAGFDGYFVEPVPPLSEDPYGLLSLPDGKFVATPHSAAKTTESWKRMVDMAIANVVTHYSAIGELSPLQSCDQPLA